MDSDPVETTLGEICRKQGGLIQTGPFGSQLHASDYTLTGTPIVMPINLIDRRIDEKNIARVTGEHVERLSRHKLELGDIVFSRRGDVTRFALVSEREAGWLCGTGCLKVAVGKPMLAMPQFIAAILASPESKEWLVRHAVGATMPNLNTEILSNIPITLPPIAEQRAIASILGALNEKIDLNRRINQTLETMAQAIFKSWFVDFDPVKAKIAAIEQGEDPLRAAMRAISGKTDTELDQMPPKHRDQLATTAALFSDAMEESELGEIPRGWEEKPLDQIASYLNGLALQKFPPESENEYLPVIKIAQLRAGHVSGADRASKNIKSEYIVQDGDVLFSWSGSLEVDIWTGGAGALNQHLFKVTSENVPKWFYYFATKHYLLKFREIAANKATTMGHIQRRHLSDAKIAIPPAAVMKAATEIIDPIFRQMIEVRLQSNQLAQLRDALLPKLLSGELSVAALANEEETLHAL